MGNRNVNISQSEFPFRLTVEVKNSRHHRAVNENLTKIMGWLFENVGPTINYRDKANKERPLLKNIKLPHDKKYSKTEPQFLFRVRRNKRRYSDEFKIHLFFRNEFDKTNFAINFT